jgi:hypothetical protein
VADLSDLSVLGSTGLLAGEGWVCSDGHAMLAMIHELVDVFWNGMMATKAMLRCNLRQQWRRLWALLPCWRRCQCSSSIPAIDAPRKTLDLGVPVLDDGGTCGRVSPLGESI